MIKQEVDIVIGGLLHDIGKVIYRQGDDRRKHSRSGYDFLKDEIRLQESADNILDMVLYHHADMLRDAGLANDNPAYIVYMADNIASAADRRQKDSEDMGFEVSMPLQSIFNILNENDAELYYQPKTLDPKDEINYPTAEKRKFDETFYNNVKINLQDNLRGMQWTEDYINSLLEVLEANLSFVPSSTAKNEMADISLYDHLKLTAAISSCIYTYLQQKDITDYHDVLFVNSKKIYDEKMFLLYSMDISGIQDFIYTISSKNALKTLRARSFYLEVMMEHVIDGLLQRLHLSRANLIYSGGGHCYMLIPNTQKSVSTVDLYVEEINQWLLEQFNIALYIADGYAVCSANTLKNLPQGSYSDMFNEISKMISRKKSNRYNSEIIKKLNSGGCTDYTRECKVCRRIGVINENGVCSICKEIENFSKNILYDDMFIVTSEKRERSLPLPGNFYLSSCSEKDVKTEMNQEESFVRVYGKNKMYTGKRIATRLWVGDYSTGKTFEEFAEEASGINRIGVLRADVDNLGQAFVSGFKNPKNQDRYVTLSRTATLSRQLSLFFKLHINQILKEASYSVDGIKQTKRNAAICYSGGDDLFIVGSWNEVIELAIDIRRCFKKYTQNTLTLSAGIGIYSSGYPISAIAREVAELEEESKGVYGKNAVTIFPDGVYHEEENSDNIVKLINDATYHWTTFEEKVIGEKYRVLSKFFDNSDERGKSFMYRLLELIRQKGDKINFARYVYILSRLEPKNDAPQEQKDNYREFSSKMYEWIRNEEDCRQLKTAINLYAYMTREQEVI